jgi:uncharacterized 2Fe-2S/4Fe-4S cluster protein (DUF4445 family)
VSALYVLAAASLAVGVGLTIRGARIRQEKRANPGAIASVEFQFLMEEDHNTRAGLGRALAILNGGESDECDAAEILVALARRAFASGDLRAEMFEAFAAAANHGEHSAMIERKIWEILKGGA